MIHKDKLFQCREYRKGSCNFTSETCWYSHDVILKDKVSSEVNKVPVFWESKEKLQPPDLMERIMTMLETVTTKVKELEVSVLKKNQI